MGRMGRADRMERVLSRGKRGKDVVVEYVAMNCVTCMLKSLG